MTLPDDTGPSIVVLVPLGDDDVTAPLAIISTAAQIGRAAAVPVLVLLLGTAVTDDQGQAAIAAGADRVWLVSHPRLALPLQTDQLLAVAETALARTGLRTDGAVRMLFLLSAGAVGEELAARLAARLSGAALGRCSHLEIDAAQVVGRRPAFAGRAQVRIASSAPLCFATMRAAAPGRGEPPPAAGASVTRIDLDGTLPAADVSYVETEQGAARVEGARIVVSGGRGIGGTAGFAMLGEIAAELGGAVGGSLPTVDEGWIPVAHQVGQSGKFVTPDIYVAVGISGTPQHMAGIGHDTRIIAINSDPEANIFKNAEIGVVSDWQAILPPLLAALRLNRAE